MPASTGTVPGSADPARLRARLGRGADLVAADLLGWRLSRETAEGTVTVELTEVEAYAGGSDPASHAFRGPTARNSVMFGPAGHLYVYLSHGIHHCANVVTGPDGEASAVLLRAGRVVEGTELARERRGGVGDHALARGPGCLGQALGLTLPDSGADLLGGSELLLAPGARGREPAPVATGPRVGVRLAHDVPWRFWVEGDPTVSVYRRNPRAASATVPEPDRPR